MVKQTTYEKFKERVKELENELAERRHTEETFRENASMLENILEKAADGICVCHNIAEKPFVRFTHWNPRMTAITGYTMEEINKLGWYQTMYPDLEVQNRAIERMARMRAGDNILAEDWVITTKDGKKKSLSISTSIIKEEGGKVYVLAVMQDITGRKRVEEALKESEEKMRSIFRAAPIGIGVVANRILLDVNTRICEMTGYRHDELINSNARMLYPTQEDFDYVGSEKYRQIAEKGTGAVETQWCRKEGTIIDVLLSSTPIDTSDLSKGVTFTALDISERKRAEEALRESEDRYRLAIESSNDGVAIVKGDLHVYVNQRFAEIFGYENPQEIIGKNYTVSVHPDDIEMVRDRSLRRQKGEAVPSRYEFKGIRKDGQEICLEASSSKTTYKGESVALTYLRDITERKKAEKEMVALQQQLQQSQKMEAVGRLAGGIAHDFNNLLTVIKGYCDLALMGLKEEGPLKRALEEINKAGERAATLTHQLLAFSRRQILESKIVNLNDLLRNLNKMLQRLIGEDIELVTILGEDLGKVKVDPGQMEQVVMNLAVNARDAMPMGGKLILETSNVELGEEHARSHVDLKPGLYVMLSVRDTGVGILPEVKEHIIEPFFTTKERGKGTGLGLSMVYGMVHQSGGSIGVESELGRGTTVKIYLPRMVERGEGLEARPVKQEMPRGSETILVVEDDETVRNLASQILKHQGYRVLEASGGEEALGLYGVMKEPIHLILTDVVMPRMSGRELADHFILLYPEMKILYMSGYTDDAIVHHGVLEEGVNYIQKPFTMEGLAKKVREVLDKELS